MHDLWAGQRLRKGGKIAVFQDINIPALAACAAAGHRSDRWRWRLVR